VIYISVIFIVTFYGELAKFIISGISPFNTIIWIVIAPD